MASQTKMTKDLYTKLNEDTTDADITFVGDGKEVKAHKCVLADRCDYFKHSFNENKANVINVGGTFLKFLKQVVKFCYLQQIEIADWSYDDKGFLHKLATSYNYGPLMNFVQRELEKRPEVPLSVDTLNEWHKNSPGEELREWIKKNALNIVNYEDCHKYTKDLMLFILPVLFEMYQEDKHKKTLPTVHKEIILWLFRWRNWSDRDEEDVRSLFSKLQMDLMFNERPAWERPFRMKLSQAVHHFMWFKEVKTSGWKRVEVLELLCFAHVNEFGQLLDAVLNVVITEHLDPSSLATIYGLSHKLGSSKLEKVLVDYLRSNTMSICTSAEFTKYPASVIEFILENLRGQVMDKQVKNHLLASLWKWKASKSEEELKGVFTKIQWEDFSRKQLAAVLRIVIPMTCLANTSDPPAPAEAKRKLSDKSQCRKRGGPRKE